MAIKVNPIVLVGIPTLREDAPLSWQWHDAIRSLQFPLGTSVAWSRITGKIVAEARNILCQQALAMQANYLLFISDDVIPPARIFEMLQRHRMELVTGIYWTKETNPKPYLWQGQMQGPHEDWIFGEYFQVDWAGCDALLIDTKVLKAMPYPWFSHDWTWKEGTKFSIATEDQYFYVKARQCGFKLYCDSSVQCGHQDRQSGTIFGLTEQTQQVMNNRKLIKKDVAKKVAVLDDTFIPSDSYLVDTNIVWVSQNAAKKPDIISDYRIIPQDSECFDEVISAVLDKFSIEEAATIIIEWLRVVKIDGKLKMFVPNAAKIALEILKADINPNYLTDIHNLLYENEKKVSYTRHGLKRLIDSLELECKIMEIDDKLLSEITKKEKSEIFNINKAFENVLLSTKAETLDEKVRHALTFGAMQKQSELLDLAKEIEKIKPKTVLEIGTAAGGVFWLLCQLAADDATIISLDMEGGSFGGGYTKDDIPRLKIYAKDTQQTHFILADSHLLETVNSIKEKLGGRKLDVLLIDGDHTYEGVKADFENYSPLVSNGGLIVFHDILFHTFNRDCEVELFWRRIKNDYNFTEFIDKSDVHWGGIGVIKWQRNGK